MAPEVDTEHRDREVDELRVGFYFVEKFVHAPRDGHVPGHRDLIVDEREKKRDEQRRADENKQGFM